MSAVNDLPTVSQHFQDSLGKLRRARQWDGIEFTEIPAPARLAPLAVAVRAEVRPASPTGPAGAPEGELATGRFVLLHDPSEPAAWGGPLRIVTWVRAAVEPGTGRDGTTGSVAWGWLLEALDRHRAGYSREGGTVSRVLAEGFGALGDQADGADVELRASWTPGGADVEPHLAAWADTVCTFAGLPPYPRGVTVLHPRR